ncbi:MAG: helix-turn-helix domain-containing protein, partial [Myxococcota bacterium]|nr:helix-turn-helix domain-containing protein [Myxococcota bacterium]
PPLRERPRDIEWLAQLLLERAARARGAPTPRLSRGALDVLVHHAFPGNVRELENLTERAVLLFAGREVDVERLLDRGQPAAPLSETLNLRDLERQAVVRSLALHHGNRTRASQALGISVRTLRNKIRSYGLA